MSDATNVTQPIDLEIERVYARLKDFTAETKEYAAALLQLKNLHALKADLTPAPTPEPEPEKSHRVKIDELLPAISNLLGIAMILQHERVHVVTSKALGFVTKSRI